MRKPSNIGWNKDYVKSLNKKDFVKEFSKAYPDHDLESEYDKIVPPKETKKDDEK